jgi:magnesium chelatase family protein
MAFFSSTLVGVNPIPVEIEIDLSDGLPYFQIVGLPDAILKESKTRVKSSIIQSGFDFPYDRRIVLNLAPSKVRKEGSGFELGLAARVLASSGQIPMPPFPVLFLGELALDGTVRLIPEIEALIYSVAQISGCGALIVPEQAVSSVKNAVTCKVVGIRHLKDLAAGGWWEVPALDESGEGRKLISLPGEGLPAETDSLWFTEFWAKHLQIAAVGRHHYLLCGPPGSGKSYFAESLRLFSKHRRIEVAGELKILDALFKRTPGDLPWAAPHHSVTAAGLLGGGSSPRPGAVTRAHGGILFLDELLEFSGAVLDSLREPVEKGFVEIYRAGQGVEFPSRVQMVAATNPCRCGQWKNNWRPCRCTASQRQMYQRRMSGPFFDRFDVRLFCPSSQGNENLISGRQISKQIRLAAEFKKRAGAPLWSSVARNYLEQDLARKFINRRRIEKVRAVAETLAVLEHSATVNADHVREAAGLQTLDEIESAC